VSVIVPVLDTDPERFTKCLESIREQRHSALEIIVVDDGSTPEYASWLDGLGDDEPRMHVVHQQRAGVSAARNTGVRRASGEFLVFVDSDDWVSPEFVDAALGVALDTRVDVVFGGILVTDGQTSAHWRAGAPASGHPLLVGDDALTAVRANALSASPSPKRTTQVTTITNVVSALFRHDTARAAAFCEGVSHSEDRLYISSVLGAAQRIAACSDIWYHYDRSPTSATGEMTVTAAEALPATMEAFARAGGFHGSREDREVDPAIRAAAAIGILNYLKTMSGILASTTGVRVSGPLLRRALDTPGVAESLAQAAPRSMRDRLFLFFARRRRVSALHLLGTVWVLTTPAAPGKRRAGRGAR